MGPFNDGFEEFNNDFDFSTHHPGPSPEMMGLFMKDILNRKQGNVEPDTVGADYFFINGFISDSMEWDFCFIEQDFLKNCFSRIPDYEVQTWYGDDEISKCAPRTFAKKRVLTAMYNGAKSGDTYCIEMIKYLYKTYFKQEYKQLKRFHHIGLSELMSISEDETGQTDYEKLGRIMGMCRFMGIEMDESCSLLYLLLEKVRKEWVEEECEDPFDSVPGDTLFQECMEQAERWMDEEAHLPYEKRTKVYWRLEKFVEAILREQGYPEDYVYMTLDNYQGIKVEIARTLSRLKRLYPNKEFSYEEVQWYMQIYSLVNFGIDMAEHFSQATDDFFSTGDIEQYYENVKDEMLYQRGIISVNEKTQKEAAPRQTVANAPAVKPETSTSGVSEAEYLKEIEELRKRVNEQEKEISHLRTVFRSTKKSQEELEAIVKKKENERDELIALRNFVYNLEHAEPESSSLSIDAMKEFIRNKKIAIIGGHVNWRNKLEQDFPKWKLIAAENLSTVGSPAIENMDMIFFFTDHISHTGYYKYVAAAREHHIPFSYLHGVNLDYVVKQIYESMK